jgi:hypothetical protein
MEGVRLQVLFERQMREGSRNGASLITLIWAFYLDPDCVRNLSLGSIWNSVWGQSRTGSGGQSGTGFEGDLELDLGAIWNWVWGNLELVLGAVWNLCRGPGLP